MIVVINEIDKIISNYNNRLRINLRDQGRSIMIDQDIIIKFCVIGESGVGKTSLLYQYIYKRFDEQVRPTIGCDFSTKLSSNIDGKTVRLQLWDIAGQERFTSVSKMYLRGALGKILVRVRLCNCMCSK
jgi:GTPase SAR1 family protein